MFNISGISERDLDLLILEEFMSSGLFQELFLKKVNFNVSGLCLVDAQRSVTTSSGESDLEITFQSKNGGLYKLLIENKIKAGFQKDQRKRYNLRGDTYIKQGEIVQYSTILVAPKIYANSARKGFNVRINYEDIVQYFDQNTLLGKRKNYKILLLKSAIEKSSLGYQPVADECVTLFWQSYRKLTLDIAKEFNMEPPENKPASSTFIYFPRSKLPDIVDLVHKLEKGHFDLQFKGMGSNLNLIEEKYRGKLTTEMRIVKANKSASIRIDTPKLYVADTFYSQKENAIKAINSGKELLKWYEKCAH